MKCILRLVSTLQTISTHKNTFRNQCHNLMKQAFRFNYRKRDAQITNDANIMPTWEPTQSLTILKILKNDIRKSMLQIDTE